MKILAISDIHGDKGLVRKTAKLAEEEKVDLIILAGDLTWFDESTKDLIGPFTKMNKEILIIPGNHETNLTLDALEKQYPLLRNIEKKPFEKNGVGFFGTGYAFAGPFFTDEEELKNKLIKSQNKIKHLSKKVLITHMHHKGSKSEFSGFEGSKE